MSCSFGSQEKTLLRVISKFEANEPMDEIEGYPRLKSGYYAVKSAPFGTYECFSDVGACVGGLPESCFADRSGLLCQICPSNFYRSGSECKKCKSQIVILCVVL